MSAENKYNKDDITMIKSCNTNSEINWYDKEINISWIYFSLYILVWEKEVIAICSCNRRYADENFTYLASFLKEMLIIFIIICFINYWKLNKIKLREQKLYPRAHTRNIRHSLTDLLALLRIDKISDITVLPENRFLKIFWYWWEVENQHFNYAVILISDLHVLSILVFAVENLQLKWSFHYLVNFIVIV